ncbi:family 16 glycoside hydrolase [Neorhodopirellula pilleata]|uniref:Cytochrome c n=1 Tax=Neorhodopirellula pilleata TaxID=2714738 RepID=A0A5C6AW46_9BACT|nr:family 16 glycoside hydrolase [Neorhodopirellula pilleata]TWU03838.1 Cytochrome c [Neorhodopirellula pilleata]
MPPRLFRQIAVAVLGVFSLFAWPSDLSAQGPAAEATRQTEVDARFQILFDGESLTRWKGNLELWSVQDGAIVGQTTAENPIKANTFLIYQGGETADFEFRCKVRFEGNNSGVQYRSELVDPTGFALAGYQADLHPNQEYFGMMYGERTGRGIIGQRGQRVVVSPDGKSSVVGQVGNKEVFVDSEWNDLRIVAVGNRMIHQVNGITTLDLTDNHPDAKRTGKLGLQLHQGPAMKVEFRNLMMRPLSGPEAERTLDAAVNSVPPKTDSPDDSASTQPKDSDWLKQKPVPQWVWADRSASNQKVWFRKTFAINGDAKTAQLYATCDNQFQIWINGEAIGNSNAWEKPIQTDVAKHLRPGQNVIAIEGKNDGGVAALLVKMRIQNKDDSTQTVVTDRGWLLTETEPQNWQGVDFKDETWSQVKVIQKLGEGPWGIPGYQAPGSSSGKNADPLHAKNVIVPPGFVVDRIYRLTPDQGSWVSLATDPKGRIYACDQAGAGLYRVTLQENGPAQVEKVSVGQLAGLSGAQGLVWAFDSLWFHRNGGHLYRLTDSDGDDVLDTAQEFPGGTGGGEHGNHAVVVTEDGEAIYMDGGNHADLAETESSRVPTWYEGLLLPRMWDSNGHARGRMAPGGWVTRLNVQTQKQILHAIGFRNQYDIALNRFGDLFTYDADMEWDLGLPWYRPTRICNVVSGADFGWRSGSGKWPTYYEDTLPPVVDIGPGSPTGVVSGTGTAFPTRYQDAIFALDWTFGTIYAIHLQPDGASYTGSAEPFVYSVPLPVTDAVVGQDGSLIFAVGGRGTESAMFRVRYVGDEATTAPVAPGINDPATVARGQRRQLEAFHGVEHADAISTAWPYLANPDRFLRHAARIAVESQPVDRWSAMALSSTDPQTVITSAVALARMGNESHAGPLLDHLLSLRAEELDDAKLLGLLRAYALTFMRLGDPAEEQRERIISQLDPMLPSANADVNQELIRVLVALRHPGVVAKAMQLIRDRGPAAAPDWSQIASRNSGYGAGVQRMIDNPPPAREIQYAFMLRNIRKGWTLDLRREYFTFLNEAATASGGASYPGYLTRTRDEALALCSSEQRKALEEITGEDFNPLPDFEILPIRGPGKVWTMETASAASRGKPDFDAGRSLFFSAQCAACHRLAGLGGDIGPDLTSVRNKFDENYVLDAIVHPSRVISDQYGSSTVLLADGTILTGLVVEQENGNLLVYPNQTQGSQEPLQAIKVDADDIEDISASKISQMPEGLLNNLNAEEIRDLMGYLMSGGDPNDKRYRK